LQHLTFSPKTEWSITLKWTTVAIAAGVIFDIGAKYRIQLADEGAVGRSY
jgi:hypothetical protein